MNDGVISKEIYDRLSWEKMANYGILMFTTEKTMGTVRRRFVKPYPYLMERYEERSGRDDNYQWRKWHKWKIYHSEEPTLAFNVNGFGSEAFEQRIITSSEMNGTLYETTEKEIQAEIRRFMSGKMIYREGQENQIQCYIEDNKFIIGLSALERTYEWTNGKAGREKMLDYEKG